MDLGLIIVEKITEFKEFVRQHSGLKDSVRNGNTTWQNIYEEWFLYGSDDKQWSPYKNNTTTATSTDTSTPTVAPTPTPAATPTPASEVISKESTDQLSGTEMMTQAFEYLQKVDIDKVQKTMGTVQQCIQIFQTMQGGKGGASSAAGLLGAAPKQNYSGFFSQFDD